jgi:hypothetical protein
MKNLKHYLIMILIGFSSLQLQAQKITVKEETNKLSKEMVSTLVMNLSHVPSKSAIKGLKSLMKDYKGNIKKEKGTYVSNETVIQTISRDKITVYFRVEENKDGGCKIITGWKLTGGYINSSTTQVQFVEAKKILRDFGVKISRKEIGKELSVAVKSQEKLEKEQSKLEKENKNLLSSIETNKDRIARAQAAIKQAETDLVSNSDNQKKKKKEIDAQKKVVEEIKKKLNNVK